jgi:catechol 2,3-dioxygenase-like lactoylglutathione lyase family enzyme
MAKLNALEHHAADFDKEVDFFKNKLGCPLVREVAGRMASFQIADDLRVVVLARDPSHPPYASFRGDTVCLEVPEVDKLCEQLKAKGVTIRYGPVTQSFGMRNFFFETPGGLTIEYETRAAQQH